MKIGHLAKRKDFSRVVMLLLGGCFSSPAIAEFQVSNSTMSASATVDVLDDYPAVSHSGQEWLYIETGMESLPASMRAEAVLEPVVENGSLHISAHALLAYTSDDRLGGAGTVTLDAATEFVMPADQVLLSYRLSLQPSSIGSLQTVLTDVTASHVLMTFHTSARETIVLSSTKDHLIRLEIRTSGNLNIPSETASWSSWSSEAAFSFQEVDCNENGIYDPVDIESGLSADFDRDGFPDDCQSPIIFVSADAVGGGDGKTWATAYQSLDDALLQAAARTEIMIRIWVAQGTYTPTTRTDAADPRSASFLVSDRIHLRGGFAGSETALSQRNASLHPTVLSGDLSGDDGPEFANRQDNAYHVLENQDPPGAAVAAVLLDSLIVRGGYANLLGVNRGSGLRAYGKVTLRNCTFEDNWVGPDSTLDLGSVAHGDGGGAVAISGGLGYGYYPQGAAFDVIWDDCKFRNNSSALTGGAIDLSSLSVQFVNCSFESNSARAGAVYAWYLSAVEFDRCSFEENEGGALIAEGASSMEVSRCTFYKNSAAYAGGAVSLYGDFRSLRFVDSMFQENSSLYNDGGAINWRDGWQSLMELVRCEFDDNRAADRGGAIYSREGVVQVEGGVFSENDATHGGAIYSEDQNLSLSSAILIGNQATVGGAFAGSQSTLDASRSIWQSNRATVGGAVAVGEPPSSAYFWGNLFQYNVAIMYGGAIAGGAGQTTISGCTLVRNMSYGLGAAVMAGPETTINSSIIWDNSIGYLQEAPTTDERGQIEGMPEISYSIVQGWTGLFGGEGNSGMDPLFMDPDGDQTNPYGDFRLSPLSPAINAGDPTYVSSHGDLDLDGHARVLCGRVDIGAYESGIGDGNCDGVVDLADFDTWWQCAEGLEENDSCTQMDFDNDGDFDLKDFAGLQRAFAP